MKALVLFYSRSGATRGVARELGHALDADLMEITCSRYRRGLLGFLRAAFDSLRGNLPPVDVPPIDFSVYDLVLVGAPIWTSYPAVPVRSFFSTASSLGRETGLFFTSEGHSPVEAAVDEVRRLWPHPIKDAIAISMKDRDALARANALLDFTVRLGAEPPADKT